MLQLKGLDTWNIETYYKVYKYGNFNRVIIKHDVTLEDTRRVQDKKLQIVRIYDNIYDRIKFKIKDNKIIIYFYFKSKCTPKNTRCWNDLNN